MNTRSIVPTLFLLALGGAGDAQITFGGALNHPVGSKPEGGALLDFNRDGHLDLVVATEQPDKLEFLANGGDGRFTAAFAVETGNATSPEGVVAGDFDSDGDLDLLVALFSSNQVQLVLDDGAGHFSLGARFAVGLEPS